MAKEENEKGRKSIEVYNLNEERLVENRHKRIDKLKRDWYRLEGIENDVERDKEIRQLYKYWCEPSKEYIVLTKQFFENPDYFIGD